MKKSAEFAAQRASLEAWVEKAFGTALPPHIRTALEEVAEEIAMLRVCESRALAVEALEEHGLTVLPPKRRRRSGGDC